MSEKSRIGRLLAGLGALGVGAIFTLAPIGPGTGSGGVLEINSACAEEMGNCVVQPGWKCVHDGRSYPDECDPDIPGTDCEPPPPGGGTA